MDNFVQNLIDPRTGKRLIEIIPDAFAIQEEEEVPDELAPPPTFAGIAVVSREERDKRYAVCKACPQLRSLSKLCKVCNCVMPAKTWLKNQGCPESKW